MAKNNSFIEDETGLTERKQKYNTDDYSELLLKHLIRSEEVFNDALRKGLEAKDFQNSNTGGTKMYKLVAEIVFTAGSSPISRDTLEMRINTSGNKFKSVDDEVLTELVEWIYTGEIANTEHISDEILEFIEERRYRKVLEQKLENPIELKEQLNKVHDDILAIKMRQETKVLSPFETIVKKTSRAGIHLGFQKIDEITDGLGAGECGLLIGHSGSGKTAFASYIARSAAIDGHNVLYISAEEPAENIVCRWYAQQFGISYTKLYKGDAELEKQELFWQLTTDDRAKLSRLRIVDARDQVPLNANTIFKIAEEEAKKGFIANVIFVDQMDFLTTIERMAPQTQKWAIYEKIANDCDRMSNRLILGINPFALWLIHQGTGSSKWLFGYEDIAGAKAIVRPFDLALGVGREPTEEGETPSNHCHIFSMKTRHTGSFQMPMKAEFEFMRFEEDPLYKPKSVRDRLKKKEEGSTEKRKPGRPRKTEIPED